MKLSALGMTLLAACASGVGGSGLCGGEPPIEVTVDSDHYNDTVIRDAKGVRIGLAGGHTVTRLRYCYRPDGNTGFILAPLAEPSFELGGFGALEPGSQVTISIGGDIRISFVTVTPPGVK